MRVNVPLTTAMMIQRRKLSKPTKIGFFHCLCLVNFVLGFATFSMHLHKQILCVGTFMGFRSICGREKNTSFGMPPPLKSPHQFSRITQDNFSHVWNVIQGPVSTRFFLFQNHPT